VDQVANTPNNRLMEVTAMPTSQVYERMLQEVIETDTNWARFERFCCAVLAEETSEAILPTSVTRDQKRDGRSLTGGTFVVATVQGGRLRKKMTDDLTGLKSTTSSPKTVFLCFGRSLTESDLDTLKCEAIAILGDATDVIPLGAVQLAVLGKRHEEIANKYYHGELEDVQRAMNEIPKAIGEAEKAALNLALCTMGHNNSREIRDRLYMNLCVRALAKEKGTVPTVCHRISNHLSLGRSISTGLVLNYLRELGKLGFTETEGSTWTVMSRLRELLGSENIDARLLDHVFSRLQESLAHLFYTRGMDLVSLVSDLLAGGEQPGSAPRYMDLLDETIDQAANSTADADQKSDIKTALHDLFREKSGPAFTWLSSVCANFVILCSVGLEHTSSVAVRRVLGQTKLVIDTDAAISLLCNAEPDHESVSALTHAWKAIGGACLLPDVVASEVAVHAWNAQNDFVENSEWLPGSEEECLRLCQNAFVRNFATLLRGGQLRKRDWSRYIGEYRGSKKHDIGPVMQVFVNDEGFEAFDSQCDESRRQALFDKMVNMGKSRKKKKEEEDIRVDKIRRDASLLCAVMEAREKQRTGGRPAE
jgi:hypothetical protein